MKTNLCNLIGMVIASMLFGIASGQEQSSTEKSTQEKSDKIAWYATWESGVAEAERSGRPILLMSAAPHCKNVSGIW